MPIHSWHELTIRKHSSHTYYCRQYIHLYTQVISLRSQFFDKEDKSWKTVWTVWLYNDEGSLIFVQVLSEKSEYVNTQRKRKNAETLCRVYSDMEGSRSYKTRLMSTQTKLSLLSLRENNIGMYVCMDFVVWLMTDCYGHQTVATDIEKVNNFWLNFYPD